MTNTTNAAVLLAIDAPPLTTLPIRGRSERFPVNRVFCVGRNYADHAREMGHDPQREPPFFFMKPSSAVVGDGVAFQYPSGSNDVHHEVELVVALAVGGSLVRAEDANALIYGYAVGLDMTRRDLQGEAKKLGRPWETGKAFDGSAPCSDIVPAGQCGHPAAGAVQLAVNGQTRQKGDIADLIWSIPETIAHLSTLFTLQPGDLIFTGTPSGVGPVVRGDQLAAAVDGIGELRIAVV
ncbi:fumarylacetoacetate hydrolase family protein [Massilia antarctica]|uniref:Fumarylacetoacetate hydrolase family protein n=1 Tax=Massilia antarctica TaxID=2765360 RepID=A0AA48W586_9BURK|nr:fumarylacetoacetate hydrolase family protein [Massilia antarctica]QPI47348.1 fumarylacetoacetate hydrolase family protein [Massilia antarctica]